MSARCTGCHVEIPNGGSVCEIQRILSLVTPHGLVPSRTDGTLLCVLCFPCAWVALERINDGIERVIAETGQMIRDRAR